MAALDLHAWLETTPEPSGQDAGLAALAADYVHPGTSTRRQRFDLAYQVVKHRFGFNSLARASGRTPRQNLTKWLKRESGDLQDGQVDELANNLAVHPDWLSRGAFGRPPNLGCPPTLLPFVAGLARTIRVLAIIQIWLELEDGAGDLAVWNDVVEGPGMGRSSALQLVYPAAAWLGASSTAGFAVGDILSPMTEPAFIERYGVIARQYVRVSDLFAAHRQELISAWRWLADRVVAPPPRARFIIGMTPEQLPGVRFRQAWRQHGERIDRMLAADRTIWDRSPRVQP